MPRRPSVDFLIVVALKDELDAAIRHFGFTGTGTGEHFATVPRDDGGEYRVAIVNVGMGPENEQRETRAALHRVRSPRAILIGIAAGFPDADNRVNLGDLMIPQRILDYESAKVGEEGRWFQKRRPVVHHRGVPERLDQAMWHAAQTLAESPLHAWTNRITVPRPNDARRLPAVFAAPNTILGCGSKVIASDLYEARSWLCKEHKGILGLEMESIGVFNACVAAGADLLVVKASQDPATALKDRENAKDSWRLYACDVAAAFARDFVGSYRVSSDALIEEHLAEIDTAMRSLLFRETPRFAYRVSLAESYTDVKRRTFQRSGAPLDSLIPNDGSPCVALIGGGGTGKTNLARRLVRSMISAGMCPILFDLGRYPLAVRAELSKGNRLRIEKEVLERIVLQTSVPRHTPTEIEVMARETRIVAVVDGLNEIPPNEQALLLAFLRNADDSERPYVVVTSRLGSRDAFEGFAFASFDLLALDDVKSLYDQLHSKGDQSPFDALDPRVREILRKPFFLALAMRGPQLAGLHSFCGIFERFFTERLSVGGQHLANIADAAFLSLDAIGGIQVAEFKARVGDNVYEGLVDAEVISRDEKGFDHELWCNFLASKHLAQHPELWIDEHFDRVTIKASSFECLDLTMEQLEQAEQRDDFVKSVYNWNLPAAVECLEFAGGIDHGDVTRGLKVAILAVIAERALDPIAHSRENARAQLAEQPSAEARRLALAVDREALVAAIRNENIDDAWFAHWFEVFQLPDESPADTALIELLASGDPILGWAASNSVRRLHISDGQQATLLALFATNAGNQGGNAVRWRILHSLGTHASVITIKFLREVFAGDAQMWVAVPCSGVSSPRGLRPRR